MRAPIGYYYEGFRQSFLFVPGFLAICASALAVAIVVAENRWGEEIHKAIPWIAWEPAGAQSILTALVGATASITGVVFSITMVILSIAASQLGPRLIRSALKRRSTKYTLGIFIGATVYALVVLTTVRAEDNGAFVPHLAVFVAILLAILSFFAMIYFIQDVAQTIQAPNMIKAVVDDLDEAIARIFPDKTGPEQKKGPSLDDALTDLGPANTLKAGFEGYVCAIDMDGLLKLAQSRDIIIHLHKRPGQFVVRNSALATVWPESFNVDEIADQCCAAFIAAPRPTPNQDVECAVNELVEIAARALSPGVNDPFTAINCVDFLGASLSRILQRVPAPHLHYDDQKTLRILLKASNFPGILGAAFDQLRQYAETNVAVTFRIMEALTQLAAFAARDEDRAALARHAAMIKTSGEAAFRQESDLIGLRARYETFSQAAAQAATGR